MSCSACRLCRTLPPLCRALSPRRGAQEGDAGHPEPPSASPVPCPGGWPRHRGDPNPGCPIPARRGARGARMLRRVRVAQPRGEMPLVLGDCQACFWCVYRGVFLGGMSPGRSSPRAGQSAATPAPHPCSAPRRGALLREGTFPNSQRPVSGQKGLKGEKRISATGRKIK